MTAAVLNANPDTPASVDYVIPATRQTTMAGNWAKRLIDNDLDIGAMRPYVDRRGRSCISRQTLTYNSKTHRQEVGVRKVLTNDANATLRFLDWIEVDDAVREASKPALVAAGELRRRNLVYNLPNGIAKTMMQAQQISDITGATVSMDPLRVSESDRPVFATVNFPLPIIHKDFQFPLRQVLASRTGQSPLDTTTARLASRRVGEQVEQFVLGVSNNKDLQGIPSYTWNDATVYGVANWPLRITYSITLPTAGGWVPSTGLNDVIAMRGLARAANQNGPWEIWVGQAWDTYLDRDYSATYPGTPPLRTRLGQLDGILGIRTVAYLPAYSIILVQMDVNTIRLVIGMDITTVSWETNGGFELNFKVMCLILPQLRGDINGNTGIVHGS